MERYCEACLHGTPMVETVIYEDETTCPVCGAKNPRYDPSTIEAEDQGEEE